MNRPPTTDLVKIRIVAAAEADERHDWFEGLLDEREHRRAGAFTSPAARRFFVIAHGVFRTVVGRELGVPPRDVRWHTGPNGKPLITDDRGACLHTNLSHSAGLVAVATAHTRQVGIDIQHVGAVPDSRAIARRFFTPHEADLLTGIRNREQRERFFTRLWCRKEAIVKAGGGLLAHGLRLRACGGAAEVAHYGEGTPGGPYLVTDTEAPHGFCCAVACSGSSPFLVRLTHGL